MSNKTKNRLGYLTGTVAALIVAALAFAIVVACCMPAKAEQDVDEPPVDELTSTNWMAVMMQAVIDNNPDVGYWAEQQRAEKIERLGLDYQLIAWEDLNQLARLVWQEAGSDGISHEWRRDVAQVVLNRVNSSEFPNTLYDVIHQSGQYSGASRLSSAQPTWDCVSAALDALEGKGDLPNSVVFQANFRQGSGVYRQYYLAPYGTTYFCYSSWPELYG